MKPRNIYVILDNVSDQLSPLFVEDSDERAVLQLSNFLGGVPHHPSNFDLYRLGQIVLPDGDIPHIEAHLAALHIKNGASVNPPEVTHGS